MKYIFILTICLFTANIAQAGDIPELPADPAVKTGVLPNGITYYAVSNPQLKGIADFALVQKTGGRNVPELEHAEMFSVCGKTLDACPRQLSRSVRDYFAGIGVIAGSCGFAEVAEDATVYRFRDVNIAQNASVLDSTLMVMSYMADVALNVGDTLVSRWYAPSDQAIIVTGDIDAVKVAEKLKLFSYMVPGFPSLPRKEYEWTETDTATVMLVRDSSRNIACVQAEWKLQRTPREYMNTVQPLVYEKYMTQFGIAVQTRLKRYLRNAGIPFAAVVSDYVCGGESLSDDSIFVRIELDACHLEEGVGAIASVVSSLVSGQMTYAELRDAECVYLDGQMSRIGDVRESNSEYVDRCISSFLYNTSLASDKDRLAFHMSKSLPARTDLDIFKSIVSSSVSRERNLVLTCTDPSSFKEKDSLRNVFDKAWMAAQTAGAQVDTLRKVPYLAGASEERVRIRSSKSEPLSGGVVLTLSNGMKVIYRKMPAGLEIHYSLILNGGYGAISGIEAGEGGYLSDCFDFCDIGGVEAQRFRQEVRGHGMTLNYDLGISNMRLSGRIPHDGLEYMMRVLLTVLNDSRVDKDAFDYYTRCEKLRREADKGTIRGRITAIDSLMCPDYRYSSCKAEGRLTSGLLSRAEAFMKHHAGKVNDGLLVLVGDIDEKELKTILKSYAAGFRTEKRAFSRPVISYQPVSRTVTETSVGESGSVDVAMSVPMALTADNYYAADMASMVIRKELAHLTAGTGVGLRVSHNCHKHPQERFNMMISLMTDENTSDALYVIRETLASLGKMEISDSEMASYRNLLKAYMSDRQKAPGYWTDAISKRYLDGKDFTTGAASKIDAVTKDKVKALLMALAKGSRVEYITDKR